MEHFEGDSLAGSYGASIGAGDVEGIPVIIRICGESVPCICKDGSAGLEE